MSTIIFIVLLVIAAVFTVYCNYKQCKHPWWRICVLKDSTEKIIDKDYTGVTHHLHCQSCGEDLDLTYARIEGGAKAYLQRARDEGRRNYLARLEEEAYRMDEEKS